jgi:hypothetical protein
MNARTLCAAATLIACALAGPSYAGTSFFFSTGDPDGKMAMASRPSSGGKIEIEAADDFVLTGPTSITSATFVGLLPTGAALSDITDVRVEIYRVFPNDSDIGRTSGAPTFSTALVPTRVNSPSDIEFADRSASAGNLTFTPGVINPSFTTANSVLNGIHPKPGFQTGGDGPVTGQEVSVNVLFKTPFLLSTDHYFFVPQVQLANGDFFWLSAPKPIVPPGTPFPSGFTDLQTWIRNEQLQPDWLRVGTDIVGGNPAATFNGTFSLSGESVPEPSTFLLLALASVGLFGVPAIRNRKARV